MNDESIRATNADNGHDMMDNHIDVKNKNRQLVGIVTFARNSANAGSCFQAWALQQFISNLPNFKAELINFKGKGSGFHNIKYAHGYGPLSWAIRAFYQWRTYRFSSFQRKHFVKFPANKPLKREELYIINDRYDQVILGSDQIWNTKLTNFSKTFFLDFVKNKKKGAYAPSIGMGDWPQEQKEEIRRLLSDFSFIGVREKQAVEVVQKLTDLPVHWSLDPTFLLNRDEWAKVARKPKETDYIFELCISSRPAVRVATEKLSKMTGLPVIEYGGARKRVPSAKRMPHPSADTWLGYLMNAKYVITDSFHGCAFCINTNTPFYAMITTYGNRITSMLELFGLQDRIIMNGDEIDVTKQFDWEAVNKKLEENRTECQNWLYNSLKG